jgi:hypothetical protein
LLVTVLSLDNAMRHSAMHPHGDLRLVRSSPLTIESSKIRDMVVVRGAMVHVAEGIEVVAKIA